MNTGNEWWKNPALARFFQQPKENNNAVAQQQDTIGGGKDGFTGNGADNIPQPERRVPGAGNGQYDVHESEFVFNAPSTQAIGADILQGIQTGAEQGTLDVNRLREVIGQPAKPGFQRGGLTQPNVPQPKGPWPGPNPIPAPTPAKNPLGNQESKDYEINAITGGHDPVSALPPKFATGIPKMSPDIKTGIGGMSPDIKQGIGGMSPDIKKGIGGMFPNIGIGIQPRPPAKPGPAIPTGQYSEEVVKPPIPAKPGPSAIALGEGGAFPAKGAPKAISDIPQLLPDTINQLNQNNIPMEDVLKYMQGLMDGSNPYFQMIKDLLMQDIGGAGAAGTAAMKQEARQRGWSEEQIASLGISRQRDVEAIGSQALGQLATEQAKMGIQAAKDLFGMELQKAQFDFAKEKYGDMEGQQIAQDINAGMTWNQIKEKYPNMTYEDYQSMKDASPLGQQAWQKQLDAINMLLGAGGEENFKNAANMLNDMFPGMDIDFSNAINAENSQNFSQGMGNLASYIASGMSWEDAFKAMQADGTLDLLNMTESDIEAMYNKLMLQQNPILQAEETYQQLLDQGIINQEEYDDMMAFLTWGLTHPEGIDISDGWVVFDKLGNELEFFKTEKEMNDWIAENPGDYNTEFMENHIAAKGTGSGDGSGDGDDDKDPLKPYTDKEWDKMSSAEQYDSFLETVPQGDEDDWSFDRWKADGGFQTYDGYEKNKADNPITPESFFDRVDKSGWSKEIEDMGLDPDTRQKLREVRENFLKGEMPTALSFENIIENGDATNIFQPHTQGTVVFFEGQDHPVMSFGLSFVMDPKTNWIAREVSFLDIDTGQVTKYYVSDTADGEVASIIPSDGSWEYTPS